MAGEPRDDRDLVRRHGVADERQCDHEKNVPAPRRQPAVGKEQHDQRQHDDRENPRRRQHERHRAQRQMVVPGVDERGVAAAVQRDQEADGRPQQQVADRVAALEAGRDQAYRGQDQEHQRQRDAAEPVALGPEVGEVRPPQGDRRGGDADAAEKYLRDSLAEARRLPELDAAVAALNNLARLLAETEHGPEALALATEALELGQRAR